MNLLNEIQDIIDEALIKYVITKDKNGDYKIKNDKSYAEVIKDKDSWHLSMIQGNDKGGGSALMKQIIADAKKEGIKYISLHTSSMNSEWFEYGFGFERVSEDSPLYDDLYDEDLISMVLYLKGKKNEPTK